MSVVALLVAGIATWILGSEYLRHRAMLSEAVKPRAIEETKRSEKMAETTVPCDDGSKVTTKAPTTKEGAKIERDYGLAPGSVATKDEPRAPLRLLGELEIPRLPAGGRAAILLDPSTGKTSGRIVPSPRPFFERSHDFEAFIRYGQALELGPMQAAGVRYEFGRAGRIYLRAEAGAMAFPQALVPEMRGATGYAVGELAIRFE